MEIATKKSVHTNLKDYCQFAKPSDFIEITEWTNQEGYTINVSSCNDDKIFNITRGEFDAIKKCIKRLNKD
jgi:hypothetical protein